MAFSILLYIVLDGADLGGGIFSLFVKDEGERGAIMEAMAGTWDANRHPYTSASSPRRRRP